MTDFVWTLRVKVLLLTAALVSSKTSGSAHSQSESITSFLQKFIKPFIRTSIHAHAPSANATIHRERETKIAKLIKKKVAELKPLLEDIHYHEKYETDDNLTLRRKDETTIIEFLPQTTKNKNGSEKPISRTVYKPDPLKVNINKYKLLREQIEIALDDEQISKDTKSLILNTLDEMLAQLIESQCTWNPTSHSMDSLLKAHNDTHDSITKVRGMSKKQWKQLRHQYLDYLNRKREKENAFMDQFHQFFSSVINDTLNLSDRYKIKCQLVELHKDEKLSLRDQKTDSKSHCDKFKVCTEELKEFLTEFYNYVNDTAVSTFSNYAEMYVRDVNVDFGIDNKVVVRVINSLGKKAEAKVNNIYKKAVNKFSLDPTKLKHTNIKLITTFIKNVMFYIKNVVKEKLKQELGAMKSKLFVTVKEDLLVNLEMDMNNLEQHYIDTLCSMFLTCNGRMASRRDAGLWTFRPRAKSEVFVKVQLSLDDEMKDAVAQSGLLQIFENPEHVKYKFNMRNQPNIDITRTTITSITTTNYNNIDVKRKHNKNKALTKKSDLQNTTHLITESVELNEILKT